MTPSPRTVKSDGVEPEGIGDSSHAFDSSDYAFEDHQHVYATQREFITPLNSFANFGGGAVPLSVWSCGNYVFVEGVIQRPTPNIAGAGQIIIGTLPTKYIPSFTPVVFMGAAFIAHTTGVANTQYNPEIDASGNIFLDTSFQWATWGIHNIILLSICLGNYLLK